MVNCGLNGGSPWLSNNDGAHCCFFGKESIEDVDYFFFDSSESRIILNLCGLI